MLVVVSPASTVPHIFVLHLAARAAVTTPIGGKMGRRISAPDTIVETGKQASTSVRMRFSHSRLQLSILTTVVAARWRIYDRLGVTHLLSLRNLTTLLVLETFAQNQ